MLDLMFLWFGSDKLNKHSIYPDWRLTSDHISLTVMISIVKEYIQTRKQIIVKDSEEEYVFVKELIEAFKNIDMSNLFNIE